MKPTYYWLLLAPILPFCPLSHQATRNQVRAVPARDAIVVIDEVVVALYNPIETDLQAEYERDRSNMKVQTWPQYREWVQTFYSGNFLSEGWARFSQVTVDVVKSNANRSSVVTELNGLGKRIGGEWAKDARVRKVNTTDLRRWNEAISEARRHDDGSGQNLLNALKTIREKVVEQTGG